MDIVPILCFCTVMALRLVNASSLKGVEEQFVDGEFPYWPYNRNSDKYSLEIDSQLSKESSGSQKVAKRREIGRMSPSAALESKDSKPKPQVVKRNHGANFYEVKGGHGFNMARVGAIEKSLKTAADPRKIFSRKSKQYSRSSAVQKRHQLYKRASHHSKVKRGDLQFEIPFTGYEEKSVFADETIPQNIRQAPVDDGANVKETPSSSRYKLISVEDFLHRKPDEEKGSPLTKAVSNVNFTDDYAYKNPNSWLINQIEKLIGHKNPRLLEFNKGKYHGVMIDSKHHQPNSKSSMADRVVGCSKRSDEYEALVQRIDSILENLTELKSAFRKGRSLTEGNRRQRNPRLKRLARILADKLISERPASKSRDIRSAKRAKTKIASKSRAGSIDDDLKELKKNLVLIGPKPIGISDSGNHNDSKNLRLHIKVYVENTDSTEKTVEKMAS